MSIPIANTHLPIDVLHQIAYTLVAHQPLGPPSQLLNLLTLSRAIHDALTPASPSSHALYARICRLKFDVGALTRRSSTPTSAALLAHLVHACSLLLFFRRARRQRDAGIYDAHAEQGVYEAWVLMLEDDGRNRRQMEEAGVHEFAQMVVWKRSGEGREGNGGWPLDSVLNSCAVWLVWMFTTKESLAKESIGLREHLISLVLPFALNPYRYASALAPPNHFSLPLTNKSPFHLMPLSTRTAHGPFPIYRSSPPSSPYTRHLSPPLITAAAKLLFLSRREAVPLPIPAHLPRDREEARRDNRPGPTQADLREFVKWKGASVGMAGRGRWDWEKGRCVYEDEGNAREEEEQSKKWDLDWWRAEMCGDIFRKQPRWRNGWVYERGMLSGLWQGFIHIPNDTAMSHLASTPQFPAPAPASPSAATAPAQSAFTEASLGLTMRPLLMRLEEHVWVPRPGDEGAYAAQASGGEAEEAKRRGRGRKAAVDASNASHAKPNSNTNQKQNADLNTPKPGKKNKRVNTLKTGNGPIPPAMPHTVLVAPSAGGSPVPIPTPTTTPTPTTDAPTPTTTATTPPHHQPTHTRVFIDANMNNAWLPGPMGSFVHDRCWVPEGGGAGGVFSSHGATVRGGGEGVDEGVWRDRFSEGGRGGEGGEEGERLREIRFCVPLAAAQPLPTLGTSAGATATVTTQQSQGERTRVEFVYETVPSPSSSSKNTNTIHARLEAARNWQVCRGVSVEGEEFAYPHPGCLRCREREAFLEGVRVDEMERRVRERLFESVQMGLGVRDDDEGEEGDGGQEEKRVVDLDLGSFSGLGVGMRRTDEYEGGGYSGDGEEGDDDDDDRENDVNSQNSGSSSTDSGSPDAISDAGMEAHRYACRTMRVAECFEQSVDDVIVTGGTDDRHADAWGRFVYYGRVRPWDGLVAILRVSTDPSIHAKFLFYGYIYGGDTFVGNWRYAGVDPIAPTLESSFVVSRRGE